MLAGIPGGHVYDVPSTSIDVTICVGLVEFVVTCDGTE